MLLSSDLFANEISSVALGNLQQSKGLGMHDQAISSIPLSSAYVLQLDNVYSLPCFCPSILQRWAARPRHWPPRVLVERVVSLGAYVTPVGPTGSDFTHIELRISFNTGVAELVNNLNDTQVKVYVLLKMILKDVIKPEYKEITSYMLKNIILWQAENTPQTEYHAHSFLHWLQEGLDGIRTAVATRQLRCFMIPEQNLMENCSLKSVLQHKWVADITDMLDEGPKVVLRLEKIRKAIVAHPEPMFWFSKRKIELEMLYLEMMKIVFQCSVENREVNCSDSFLVAIRRRQYDKVTELIQRMHAEISSGENRRDFSEEFSMSMQRSRHQEEVAALGEAPKEFPDLIMSTRLEDPVILPEMKTNITHSVIDSDQQGTFTKIPLSMDMATPTVQQKKRIKHWKLDLLCLKKDWLIKIGSSEKDWKKHWFVLTGTSLSFYKDPEAEEANALDGILDMSRCFEISEVHLQKNYGFNIKTRNGELTLSASTSVIRTNWMKALRLCMDLLNSNKSMDNRTPKLSDSSSSRSSDSETYVKPRNVSKILTTKRLNLSELAQLSHLDLAISHPSRYAQNAWSARNSIPFKRFVEANDSHVTASSSSLYQSKSSDKMMSDDDDAKSPSDKVKFISNAKSPKLHSPPTVTDTESKFVYDIDVSLHTDIIPAKSSEDIAYMAVDETVDGEDNLPSAMPCAGKGMSIDLPKYDTTFCELYRECWEQQRGSLYKGVHQSLLSLFSVGRVFHLYSQWSSIHNRGAMGKADPRTAKGGKRKASRAASPEEPAPKQNRLATLIAEAISQDREVLEEIQTLLTAPTEPTRKPDGTSSAIFISETDNISEESDDVSSVLAMSNFGDGPSTSSAADISLGVFSVVHPPLDQNTMNKIVNGEYVDFPSLIFKDQNHETTTIHKTQSSTITSTHKASRKQLHNIHQWNEAFQIYSDIYTQKYPTQAPHLFRYMTIIQRLSNSTRAWLTYDEKFRRLRAACPSIPWGTVHIETFLFCTTLGQSQPFRTSATPSSGFRSFSNRPNKSPFFRRGYCWDFQQVGSCERPRCTQAHRCGGCEGPHGAFQCNQPFLKPKRNNFASPFTPKPSSFGKPTTSQQQQQQQQK